MQLILEVEEKIIIIESALNMVLYSGRTLDELVQKSVHGIIYSLDLIIQLIYW